MAEIPEDMTRAPWYVCIPKRIGKWMLWGGLFFGAFVLLHWWQGPLRYLQFHSTEILEYYKDTGPIRFDAIRCIRAKCSEEEFHEYAANQRLVPIPPKGPYDSDIRWVSCPESWWTPPGECEPGQGYYAEYADGRRTMAYANGYLYYEIQTW